MTEEVKIPAAVSDATESVDVRYLDPKSVRLFRHGAALRLVVEGEFCVLKASVVRAFPLSRADRYLSVLDGTNKEVGVIVSPDGLDAESRRLLDEELARRYHLPIVIRVVSIRERFSTQEWNVETNRGRGEFTTRNLHDATSEPSPDRLIITDVENNRYEIPRVSALDPASRRFLAQHL